MKRRRCPVGRPIAARVYGREALVNGAWSVISATTFAPTKWAR